jgi:hypothetical protein
MHGCWNEAAMPGAKHCFASDYARGGNAAHFTAPQRKRLSTSTANPKLLKPRACLQKPASFSNSPEN